MSESSQELKLLPCPFCGSEAEIERRGTARQSMIVACTNCGGRLESGDVCGLTPSEGLAWNRRKAAIPDVLFDGHAVWESLDERAKTRTSPENVCDVLDAVVRLIRRSAEHHNAAGSTPELSPKAKHALQLCAIAGCGDSDLTGKNLRDVIVKIYGSDVDKELEAHLSPNSELSHQP